ncbi:MAG: hypothetical protein J6T16_06760 [Opitutales bacterium]|nr:hypothetical protein [Opitutales bacterium]
MPVYRYITLEADGTEGEIFEVEQPAKSPALKTHPENGKRVRRIYDAPNIQTQYTRDREKKLSDIKYIKSRGFEVLEKDKISGKYFKK